MFGDKVLTTLLEMKTDTPLQLIMSSRTFKKYIQQNVSMKKEMDGAMIHLRESDLKNRFIDMLVKNEVNADQIQSIAKELSEINRVDYVRDFRV
jgi:cell division protein FtsI/penicillin-binding protein 2